LYVQAIVDHVKTENEVVIVDFDAVIEGVKNDINFLIMQKKCFAKMRQ
jgi:hypothetical protein